MYAFAIIALPRQNAMDCLMLQYLNINHIRNEKAITNLSDCRSVVNV